MHSDNLLNLNFLVYYNIIIFFLQLFTFKNIQIIYTAHFSSFLHNMELIHNLYFTTFRMFCFLLEYSIYSNSSYKLSVHFEPQTYSHLE